MNLPALFRRAVPAPSAAVALAEPIHRLTRADMPPRRFDEAADDLAARSAPSRGKGRRFYSAASPAGFLSWDTTTVSADGALYFNLNVIKARARDLARNNDYARHFLRLLESNVIGPNGVTFQSRRYQGDALDRVFNLQLEAHWKTAGKLKHSPTVCGRMTRRETSALWLRTLAIDGEVLEIFHPNHGNRYRYATQIVDSALIDWTKNELLPNGNRIKMGVEIDQYDKPVAFWLLNHHPGDYVFASLANKPTHQRVPASRARLSFLQEFAGQTRGVSWLASPAIRAQMLQKFEEAVIVTSRAAASKGGFYEVSEDFEGTIPGEEDEGATASDMVRKQVEPGEWEFLPRGVTAKPYDPQFPPQGLDTMAKVMLRGLASGLGGSYVHMANNLEGVNYSSIRSGDLEQRGIYRALQRFVIDHHEEPIFCAWAAILRMNPDTPIDGRKLDTFLDRDEYRFLGRGWDWVDPLKEVQAHKEALKLKLKTRGDILSETTGEDFEELLDRAAEEEAMMTARGMDPRIDVAIQSVDPQKPADSDPPADADPEDDAADDE
jgi:lambda family phage portal protein